MSKEKAWFHLAVFFGVPFVIAAAFHYSDWLGWPALFAFGLFWCGNLGVIMKTEL